MDGIITNRKELLEYLKRHDPDSLEFFKAAAKAFGRPEIVAYVRRENDRTKDSH